MQETDNPYTWLHDYWRADLHISYPITQMEYTVSALLPQENANSGNICSI